jgi:ribosomal protein S27E
VRNPHSMPYDCADCGTTTKINVRTGRLYSHQAPDALVVCSASGNIVAVPQGGEPMLLPPLGTESRPAPPKPSRAPVDEPSASVRTVSGGLPGLGKRH